MSRLQPRGWPIVALLLSVAALQVPGARASSAEACLEIDAALERLACYDSLHGRTSAGSFEETRVDAIPAPEASPIEERQLAEAVGLANDFLLTPHRPNYILPGTYNATADYDQYGPAQSLFSDAEIKFQLSLKQQVLSGLWGGARLSVAYTQQSFWQLYADDEVSAPFRETNYEPELMLELPLDFELFGFRARQAAVMFNHQSNGRARPLSRSWNRLIGEIVLERGQLVVSARGWVRADDPETDDNPDIQEFMGRARFGAAYRVGDHLLSIAAKSNLRRNHRGGVELNWSFPLYGRLRGFVQYYGGHGENLIDMENVNNRFGVGVALSDVL